MRFVIVAHGRSETNDALAGAAASLGLPALVLAPRAALAHDRHLTARLLRRAGIPHPQTWLLGDALPSPAPELPVFLHPRFGSFSGERHCETADELEAALAELRHAVIAQRARRRRGSSARGGVMAA